MQNPCASVTLMRSPCAAVLRLLLMLSLVSTLSGCALWSRFSGNNDDGQATSPAVGATGPVGDSADSSRNALDWPGTYEGVLPCADCEGIRTRLTLGEDLRYSLSREYLDRNPIAFVDSGEFTWSEDGGRIVLDSGDEGPDSWLVGEDRLFQLDMEGQRISGALADNYTLLKISAQDTSVAAQLSGKRWLLRALNGQDIAPAANPAAQIFLQFNAEGASLHGFAGCNSFSGSYVLEEPTRLRIPELASTLRACLDQGETARESELLAVLREVDSFAVADGRLSLHRARMAPLAVFEAD